jgi:hypothetical protein
LPIGELDRLFGGFFVPTGLPVLPAVGANRGIESGVESDVEAIGLEVTPLGAEPMILDALVDPRAVLMVDAAETGEVVGVRVALGPGRGAAVETSVVEPGNVVVISMVTGSKTLFDSGIVVELVEVVEEVDLDDGTVAKRTLGGRVVEAAVTRTVVDVAVVVVVVVEVVVVEVVVATSVDVVDGEEVEVVVERAVVDVKGIEVDEVELDVVDVEDATGGVVEVEVELEVVEVVVGIGSKSSESVAGLGEVVRGNTAPGNRTVAVLLAISAPATSVMVALTKNVATPPGGSVTSSSTSSPVPLAAAQLAPETPLQVHELTTTTDEPRSETGAVTLEGPSLTIVSV